MELGISPERLLFAKLRKNSAWLSVQQSGNSPDNRLSERSTKVGNSLTVVHRNETDPVNIFLERFIDLTVGGSDATGPRKRLELKSNV